MKESEQSRKYASGLIWKYSFSPPKSQFQLMKGVTMSDKVLMINSPTYPCHSNPQEFISTDGRCQRCTYGLYIIYIKKLNEQNTAFSYNSFLYLHATHLTG